MPLKVGPCFLFSNETWDAFLEENCGIVNAPTGSGKTYSLFGGALLSYLENNSANSPKGPLFIWVTPIRALAKEFKLSIERIFEALELDWEVSIRSGDYLILCQKKAIYKTASGSHHYSRISPCYSRNQSLSPLLQKHACNHCRRMA